MDAYRPPDEIEYDNPYAPPRSSSAPDVPRPVANFVAIPFNIDSIVTASWSIYMQNLGPCLWVFWAVTLIDMGIGIAVSQSLISLRETMAGDQRSYMVLYVCLNLLSAVIQVWLSIGMTRGLIKIVRGEPLSFGVLFSGGRYLWTTILAAFAVGVLYVAAGFLPFVVLSASVVGIGNGSSAGLLIFVACCALFLFLFIYLSARLLLFYFLVIDRDAGAVESIGLAWQMTRGRVGTIILVYLMQLTLILAGLVSLCVGLIFTLPLRSLLMVVTYLAIVGPPKAPERMPLFRWEEDLQGG